jgi:microcystin-dependent protein
MANPFLGEIRIVGFNFAPTGWALCNGQILPIAQNTALFSLLGTTYGGDGRSTFALPNLQGSAPLHFGQGNGLTPRDLGETGGEETVTLLPTQMPAHTHSLKGSDAVGSQGPANGVWAKPSQRGTDAYNSSPGTSPQMSSSALSPTGNGQPHNNLMPYLTLNFCIALQGVFPARG